MQKNFLEQLVSEYFDYRGYFVKNNLKARRREKGGYELELDVLAYCPAKNTLYHVETSFDAYSWQKRFERFRKKFSLSEEEYARILNLRDAGNLRLFKRAIILTVPRERRREFYMKTGAKVLSVGDFMRIVQQMLKNLDPWHRAVPENYPTLRSIQFLLYSKKL